MWWDERRSGGRLKSLAFLMHPGPSLLVTLTFVAIASLAGTRVPGLIRVLQLICIMLPIQFAIGIANDLADADADATSRPYKPLVRGAVSRRTAVVAAGLLAAGGLVAAATISAAVLALSAGGLAAGLAYDLGLGRTPLSLLPWWAAFLLLPLAAYMAAGRAVVWWAALVSLSGLLAFSLHCANAVPDVDEDRVAGRRSLPVLLGRRMSRALAAMGLVAAGAVAAGVAIPLGQQLALVAVGAGAALVAALTAGLINLGRPFALMAPAGAVLAITWLAALPSS